MAKINQKFFKVEDTSTHDGNQLNVLLVENSPFQQLFIGRILKQLGHTVSVAGDGFEALSAIQRDHCYDVLLISCHLPLMDGIKATKFIREAERTTGRHLPIIGMSATASPEDCFKAGMDDFLRKPLQKLLLKAVLGRWLREKNGRKIDSIQGQDVLTSLLLIGAVTGMAFIASVTPGAAQSGSAATGDSTMLMAPTRTKPSPAPKATLRLTPRATTTKLLSGIASWYGKPFHGRKTASGQIYDMNKLTAAHLTLPLSSEVLVVNPSNGKKVVIKVTDRGPYKKNRVIDLSRAAAKQLGMLTCGLAYVTYSVVSAQPRIDSRSKLTSASTVAQIESSRPAEELPDKNNRLLISKE